MSKKRSLVILPVTGSVSVSVEHEEGVSEADIIAQAMDEAAFWVEGGGETDAQEFNTHAAVTTGNVCHAVLNDAYIDSTEDVEEV